MKMRFIDRNRNYILHMLMAFTGGCTGMYAIMLRGNFGQAQTANLIELVMHWVVGDSAAEVLFRLLAFGIFMTGLGTAHHMERNCRREMNEAVCFISDICGVIIAGLIPEEVPEIPALYPVFLITGFQWGVFSGAGGYNCSTIFCTNNSRQALFGWMDYIQDHNGKSLQQAVFYTFTLICFYCGAAAVAKAAVYHGTHAVWIAVWPPAAAFIVWIMTGGMRSGKERGFTEGPQNYRRGSAEM